MQIVKNSFWSFTIGFAIIERGTVEDAAVPPFLSLVSLVPGKTPTTRLESQTMQNAKAIPTLYKGVVYRSRGEARWAVFFDTLNLSYDYELEGYQLPSGWYLPDFYIRAWDAFVEIKPQRSLEPDEVVKGFELQETTGKRIIILVGSPYPAKYVGLMYPGDSLTIGGEFAGCNHCRTGMALSSKGSHLPLLDNGCFNVFSTYSLTKPLAAAYRAAISARFEHGQEGAFNA